MPKCLALSSGEMCEYTPAQLFFVTLAARILPITSLVCCDELTRKPEAMGKMRACVTLLFNKSLESKQIPKIWKCANISPIFKKGTKDDVNNYRPVSLTCILCKVMESIVRQNHGALCVK